LEIGALAILFLALSEDGDGGFLYSLTQIEDKQETEEQEHNPA